MKLLPAAVIACTLVAGCVQPLSEYRPVVDPAKSKPAKFEGDLVACRAIAQKAEAEYIKRSNEQFTRNMIVGVFAGAILGAAVGNSDTAAYGAAAGGAAGAAASGDDYDLITYGPRRIVDRCMADRGHVILNDIGRG